MHLVAVCAPRLFAECAVVAVQRFSPELPANQETRQLGSHHKTSIGSPNYLFERVRSSFDGACAIRIGGQPTSVTIGPLCSRSTHALKSVRQHVPLVMVGVGVAGAGVELGAPESAVVQTKTASNVVGVTGPDADAHKRQLHGLAPCPAAEAVLRHVSELWHGLHVDATGSHGSQAALGSEARALVVCSEGPLLRCRETRRVVLEVVHCVVRLDWLGAL